AASGTAQRAPAAPHQTPQRVPTQRSHADGRQREGQQQPGTQPAEDRRERRSEGYAEPARRGRHTPRERSKGVNGRGPEQARAREETCRTPRRRPSHPPQNVRGPGRGEQRQEEPGAPEEAPGPRSDRPAHVAHDVAGGAETPASG